MSRTDDRRDLADAGIRMNLKSLARWLAGRWPAPEAVQRWLR